MTKVIISFANSALQLFDLETGKVVTETFNGLAPTTDTRPNSTQINRVITHRTMPIAITAHEDRTIRFFDLRAHECQHTMVAHLDAVATLDISPNGMVLVSGGMPLVRASDLRICGITTYVTIILSFLPGHDSSVRLWDIGSRACLQEFTAHRKTYDEAIHTARFHPRASAAATGGALAGGSSWLATGGADACVKVFTCS